MVLRTRSYNVLNELYKIFIINNKKIVPINIFELLDEIRIAHWIIGDGAKQRKGLVLCTDNFSNKDVARLINVLLIKYDIRSAIHFNKKQPRIYISGNNFIKLKNLVLPHMSSFSLYKLGIGRKIKM